jgi:hypothetical protein
MSHRWFAPYLLNQPVKPEQVQRKWDVVNSTATKKIAVATLNDG